MQTTVVTAPTREPVTLTEAKAHCHIDGDDHDEDLTRMIAAARSYCESWTRRQFVRATLRLHLDAFTPVIRPRCPPLIDVQQIAYTDTDGASQTLDAADYQVDTASVPGRIVPAYGTTWPSTRAIPNAVQIDYRAGYGDPPDVPEDIKHAIRLLVAHWFSNREAVGQVGDEMAFSVRALLRRYRVMEFY